MAEVEIDPELAALAAAKAEAEGITVEQVIARLLREYVAAYHNES